MSKPLSSQRKFTREALHRAIEVICLAWTSAKESESSWGYSSGKGFDGAGSSHVGSDMAVAGPALQGNDSSKWLDNASETLTSLLACADATQSGRSPRWTGPFWPPKMQRTFCEAADEMVALWPARCERIFNRLYQLADTAAREWPATPAIGQEIDGIKVGERLPQIEVCAECRGPVAGGAADPIRRLEGIPYHKEPCYETARKRRYRRSIVPSGQ